jgi:hypothetical protein
MIIGTPLDQLVRLKSGKLIKAPLAGILTRPARTAGGTTPSSQDQQNHRVMQATFELLTF